MTVRKRGASWYVDICDKGRPRVQRVIKGARTKADALRVEAKLRTEIFEKRYGLVERPEFRFDKFVDDSFLPFKKLKKSYKSIESICKGLKSYFGKYLISEIDIELIEKYRQVRVEQKTRLGRLRSLLRVNKEIQVLSSIFTLALEKELIRSRPRTHMFRISSQRVRYLSRDEETRLITALDDCEWLKRLVIMALHTGMRHGEICNLQWADTHLERRLIHLRNTKNGKDRIVPMNATVMRLLENQQQVSSYVFPVHEPASEWWR
jgi:integrase